MLMEILKKTGDYNILLNQESTFLADMGWQENMQQFEKEILEDIINPIKNYETVRFIHSPYSGLTSNKYDLQSDIWYKFYFLDGDNQYEKGLNYNLIGITPRENAKMLKQSTKSFFRLEFFKTPNNEPPTRLNRKLVFSKNLSLPIGEKFYYNTTKQYIFIPVFTGSNYRNKENMYLFWFQDDSVLNDTNLSGNTFFMSAKFYNGKDGNVIDFTSTGLTTTQTVLEERDMYYQVIINKNDYSYKIYKYNGTIGDRVGNGLENSIKFYEKR